MMRADKARSSMSWRCRVLFDQPSPWYAQAQTPEHQLSSPSSACLLAARNVAASTWATLRVAAGSEAVFPIMSANAIASLWKSSARGGLRAQNVLT